MSRAGRVAVMAAAALFWAGPLLADSFLSLSAKAEKAERIKDAGAALQAWSQALRLWKPADGKKRKAKALCARAALQEQKGDWELALRDLSQALELDTKDAAVFHRRGRIRLEHGQVSRAISDFYQATALKIDFAQAFWDRARAYSRQGDENFAREDYRTACRLGFKPACGQTRAPEVPAQGQPQKRETAASDFKSCISRLAACAAQGQSYGTCVAYARLCEEGPRKGCCPTRCVTLFKKLLNTKSEAQAFRDVFKPGNSCVSRHAP